MDELTEAEEREVGAELALRERADRIAAELGLDTHDVRLILRLQQLTPSERLRRGLAHGRIVRRVAR